MRVIKISFWTIMLVAVAVLFQTRQATCEGPVVKAVKTRLDKIYARPLQSTLLGDMLPHASVEHKPLVEIYLKPDIKNNRVTAHLTARCKDSLKDHLPPQDFLYFFRRLNIDQEKKVILFKDQVVAKYSDPSQRAVMQPPFELKYEVDSKSVDMGGDHPEDIQQVYVYLEKVAPEKK